MPKRRDTPATPRGRGRPPKPADAPPEYEASNFNLPVGMKDEIRLAMAALRIAGAEDAPKTMRDFVVAAIREKIARSASRKPAR